MRTTPNGIGAPVQHQMRAVLDAADAIARAAGCSLANVVRAHHFVGDLNLIYPALQVWNERLAGAPIPFAVVRMPAPMPIPGCDVIMDAWVYCRGG